MQAFLTHIIGCAILEVLAGLLMPEGQMKKFSMSIISIFLFYSLVVPIVSFINGGLGL